MAYSNSNKLPTGAAAEHKTKLKSADLAWEKAWFPY
jgi:hypothetical protein